MKLADWARKQGVSYRVAWNHYKAGRLDVPARQLPTGTIFVDVPDQDVEAVIYCRVSSHDQKAYLPAQLERCMTYAKKHGLAVSDTVMEVGSGMNGKR
jgi:putative resolvase